MACLAIRIKLYLNDIEVTDGIISDEMPAGEVIEIANKWVGKDKWNRIEFDKDYKL